MTRTAFAYCFLVPMFILAMVSCGKKTTVGTGFSDEQHEQIEQQLSRFENTDSLDEALSQFKRENNVLGQMVALRMLGRAYRNQSMFDKAISLHLQGMKMAEDANDTLEIVFSLNNLGTNYRRLGALSDGAEHHAQAYRLSQKQDSTGRKPVKRNMAIAINGMASVLMAIGNLQQADSMFHHALAIEKSLSSVQGEAINLANMGNIREKEGDIDAAWQLYRRALALSEESDYRTGISQSYNNIGRLYELSGQFDVALQSYTQAYRTVADSRDYWHRMEAGLNIAHIHLKRGDYAEATRLMERIATTATRIGSLEHQARVHQLYYELYVKKGDQRSALSSYLMADHLRDSLLDLSKMLQIQGAQLDLERQNSQEAKVQADKDMNQVLHSRRMTIIGAGLLLLAAFVGIAMLLYSLHIRNERQRMMKQLSRAREQFFTHLTHEFRTPLTVILGLGHQLEDQDIEDMGQVRSAAKMIVRQGNSLLSLINQLLDISKVRSAVGEPKWRQGNIVPFVGMIVENFQSYAASKRIELTYSHSLNTIDTDFVPGYLTRIVSNLLGNAIKWTPTYGKVNLTLETTTGNCLKLQVFDTGCGISPEAMPHIFEAFYQGELNSGQDVGTGIGLSLVKLMTEAMNGTVTAQSILGQGSTFTVLLPIVQDSRTALLSEEEKQPDAVLDLSSGELLEQQPEVEETAQPANQDLSTTVLIVEDNQDIAYYVGMHLPRHKLIYARSGAEALEKAQETMPDLIIADLMMPGEIDGLELCRRVRSSDLLNHVPIIIITAKTTEEDRVTGLRAGADAYLVKPFSSEELLVRVEKLLERQQVLRQKFMQPDEQPAVELAPEDRQFMNKLIDQVYLLMAQGHTDVESLANRMALSRSQLNRRVMGITGQNTSTYVMSLRLGRAKRLLMANVQTPVGDVALKCGFDDVAYFSRIFRQTFGMTPSQYRKQG